MEKIEGGELMCTAIEVTYPKGAILGRTMDIQAPVSYQVFYQPATYWAADNLLGGIYKRRYRTLGVGFRRMDPLKDGVNDYGLVGLTNEFFGSKLYAQAPKAGYKNMSSFHYLGYALSHYRNIAELRADLQHIRLAKHNAQGEKVLCPDFHYMFTDRTGQSIVLEPKNGELLVYDNPYQVLTNAPAFPKHIMALEKLIDLNDLKSFQSAKRLPGGYDPKSRFIRAFYLTQMQVPAQSKTEALGHFFRIMGTVALPKGFFHNQQFDAYTHTLYTCAYSTSEPSLYLQGTHAPTVQAYRLADIDPQKGRQIWTISDQFKAQRITEA